MIEQIVPTEEQLWEQDRALLDEYGKCHIETICGVAAQLRAKGKTEQAAELDRQCARMRIILMPDDELIRLYERTDGEPGEELSDLLAAEIEHRGLDT
jgi:hypothetical protein